MEHSDALGKKNNTESFEEEFARKTAELEKKRQEYYKKRGERHHRARDEEHLTVYKAKTAVKSRPEKKLRGEGALRRTLRLIRGLRETRLMMRGKPWYTAERRRAAYGEVFRDAWQPLCSAIGNAVDTGWDFLCRLASDFWSCLLFLADMLIAAWYYLGSFMLFLWDLIWDVRLWIEKRKRTLFGIFVFGVSTVALAAVVVSSMTAYEYSYHGRMLGITKTPEAVYDTIEALGDKLSKASGANVSLDVERDIEFRKIYGFNNEIDSREDILTTITYMKDLQVQAYAISIDGQDKVILQDELTAKRILDSIKNDFTPTAEGVEYTSVDFVEKIDVHEVDALLGDIWNSADAKQYIEVGATNVPEGYYSNPMLTVATTENYTYTEDIDYGTQFVKNSKMYIDEKELVSPGVYGKNQIVAQVRRVNGEEISRQTVSITQIVDPVDEVYYIGTMALPVRSGSGTFIYPLTTYTITSRFGIRWGRMHKGVDLAAATGTRIHAADGGTVTFAGWKGSYGYLVMIDHGGLFETLYAHCSKLDVSVGDQVYQGQTIAEVGSTGNSTGPHCHFEVHYKGEPQDPLSYL